MTTIGKKTRELYWGKDIREAFPKDQYKIEPSEKNIIPEGLYCIEKYLYQSNTVVFQLAQIWESKSECPYRKDIKCKPGPKCNDCQDSRYDH